MSKKSKPKFYADEGLPEPIFQYVKSRGFSIVKTTLKHHPDENICQQARKESRIVLTMNPTHFWNENKCKTMQTSGVVILNFDPSEMDQANDAFCMLWNGFARDYSYLSSSWNRIKTKISSTQLSLKWISEDNRLLEESYKIENGEIVLTKKNPICESCEYVFNCGYYD